MTIIVSKNGDGDYRTIGEAFEAAKACEGEVTILVFEGVYEERPVLDRSYVNLIGAGADRTIITSSEYAYRDHEDGRKVGTFRTATFMADCDHFMARGITFENRAGQGSKVGQAIALYADGQDQFYEECRMLGYQDTVFTAPLPLKEKQKDGFLGPKQFAQRRPGSMRFKNCRIEGNIDYIFGGADAYFEGCVLFTRKREDEGVCYVTAASTPEGQKRGYVFKDCRFLTDAPEKTVYLGRPWRDHAKTVILNCELDKGIAPEGWQDWDKPHGAFYYAEWKNYGPGSDGKRADYVIMLSNDEAAEYF
ncbi:MAG: pectin methylesterase [Lachnospiraceae bacterium]|nr:pectin methylesterase [Lachnospiraceae bacterium]